MLDNQRFALNSPVLNVPELEACLAEANSTGLSGISKLLMAAAPAVGVTLDEPTQVLLARLAERRRGA